MSQRYWGYAGPHGEAGPVSTDELALFLRERLITVDTPVCPIEGMNWAPLSHWLPELAPFGVRGAGPTPLPAPGPSPWDPIPQAPPPQSPPPLALPQDPTPFILTPAPASAVRGWTDRKPHPWRRYWARMLDIAVMGGVTWFVIGFVAGAVAPEPTKRFFDFLTSGPLGKIADALLTLVVAIPGNAILLGLTGGTLGKWLFGIKVVRPDGRPIGVAAALWRELRVWVQGQAMGVPLISLFTLFGAYSWLNDDGHAPWDKPRQRAALHRPAGALQILLILIGLVLLFSIRAWIAAGAKTPWS